MKRVCLLITSLIVVLFFTQCKKEQSIGSENKTVTITLDIKHNNDNSKVIVNPPHVNFESGDMIYVASNGVYIGTLEHDGNHFIGSINDPTEGLPLYFYFLGNQSPGTLTAGTSTSCYVNISDQTSQLPVISYAPSNEEYSSEITTYTAILQNQCALAKFCVSTPSNAAICITGMNNRVNINFSTNNFTYSQINNGIIRLAGESGENIEKLAILFPQDALTAGTFGSIYSFDGSYSGTRPAIPAISRNAYLSNGINLTLNSSSVPTGALKGLFSVSATKQVYFSQGNLQYNPKAKSWQFAYPQYALLHTGWTGDSNVSSEYTSSYTGWIDMFGWATSGTYHGAICHFPYSTDQTDSKYYAYGNSSYNLFDRSGAADWGYNSISNGGNQVGYWRTLTSSEWNYVLNSRATLSGIRYAKGCVDGIQGLIILPDHWMSSIYPLSNTNNSSSSFVNTISATDWTDVLEANGAVFLPSSGWRDQTNVIQSYNYYGYYWASDIPIIGDVSSNAKCLIFQTTSVSTALGRKKHYGSSVRLIQDRVHE